MDGSVVGRGCLALRLHVVYKGRALPLAWRVRQSPKGHGPEALPIAMVALRCTVIPEGAKVVSFRLAGREYQALDGGPEFRFTEAISLVVNCEDQPEIDRLWSALTADGGEEGPCGWLKDRFGLSWQITPTRLMELLLEQTDKAKASRVMGAMMTMMKIDIAALEAAAAAG